MAERRMQPRFIRFRKGRLLILLLALAVGGSARDQRPDRKSRPPVLTAMVATPLPLPAERPDSLTIGGLWRLSSPEPRLGGISALHVAGGRFTALTDNGVVIRWPVRKGQALFADLPTGPGTPFRKEHRDAEALLSMENSWWIAFEQNHSVYRFDESFGAATGKTSLRLPTWWRNWGIEAAVVRPGGKVLLLAENGDVAIAIDGRHQRLVPLAAPGQISDAARLPDGRVVVSLREVRPWGITNQLGWLVRSADGYAVTPFARLPLGRWNNVEGLAAEPLTDGATRLWFVTDDDFRGNTVLGWAWIGPQPRPKP